MFLSKQMTSKLILRLGDGVFTALTAAISAWLMAAKLSRADSRTELTSLKVWHFSFATVTKNEIFFHGQFPASFSFLKMGLPGLFFVYYRPFFKHKIYRLNCRRQRDSNSDCQSRRRARWPLDLHLFLFSFVFSTIRSKQMFFLKMAAGWIRLILWRYSQTVHLFANLYFYYVILEKIVWFFMCCKCIERSKINYLRNSEFKFLELAKNVYKWKQRTLTVGGSITVQLVSSFTSLESTGSLHTKTTYFLCRPSPVLSNWRPAVQWYFPQQWVNIQSPIL